MTTFGILTSILQDSTYLASAVVGLLFLYVVQLWVKYKNFPPGPWGIPILGYGPFLAKDTLTKFKNMKNKYGNICSVNFGARMVVIINNHDLMKEVYLKQGDKCTGYLQGFSIGEFFSFGKGTNLFNSEGENWKEQRRFLTSNLRDFGFGKMKMEKNIQVEAEHFLHMLRDLDGQACDLLKSRRFAHFTANIIAILMFGTRFDMEDPKVLQLVQDIEDTATVFSQTAGVEIFPFVRYLPDCLSGLGPLRRIKNSILTFVRGMVREHEETYNLGNMRDMVDIYLRTNKEMIRDNGQEEAPYTMEHLLGNIMLLFGSGTEDPVALISWTLMLAALNPECQKKLQEELDKTIGRQRLPSWMDKSSLVYVEAFLLEVQRVGAPFPLSMIHSTLENMTIAGYHIPARTHIMANYWLIYTDPAIWGDPENFRPERFIDSEGKINRMRDYIMTFGMGKRTCIGEPLARMEVFILLTAILQNFDLKVPPDSKTSTYASQPDFRRLTACNLCAIPRD